MKRRSKVADTADIGRTGGTQAVRRAVAILRAFTDAHPEWGLSELARAIGLHKTTAFRLLATLEVDGMVARGAAAGSWRLGPDAIALGARALRATDLRTAARRELAALAALSGETTTLEVLIDSEVLILDEVHGTSLVGTTPSIGTRWPAHATSTGKVLLAASSDPPKPVPGRRRLASLTAHTITSYAALDAELERVRERGYAVAAEELEIGFVAVGAPVRNHDGRVVAAISVGGPAQRMSRERVRQLAPLVQSSADRISRALGSPVGGTGAGTANLQPAPILRPAPSGRAATSSSRRRHSRTTNKARR